MLVLQCGEVNASRINTVIVCLLTSNIALAKAPRNTLVPRRRTGLPRWFVANASQVAAVNKCDLDELIGTVPREVMDAVDDGLRWFLHLD